MTRKRTICAALLLALAVPLLGTSPAAAADRAARDRARRFIESRPEPILFFMHPTAEHKKLEFVAETDVRDGRTGRVIPGAFCHHWRFRWKSSLFNDFHYSDLKVFYDDRGRLDALQGGGTSTFVAPFAAANGVLDAVKNEVINGLRDDPVRQRQVRRLIEDGDAKGLLTLLLALDQP